MTDMGWSHFKDGQLLSAAQNEFDVFVTVDRNLPYQQHLPKFRIAVIILRARPNRLIDLVPLVPTDCFTKCADWRGHNNNFLKLLFVYIEASQRQSMCAP